MKIYCLGQIVNLDNVDFIRCKWKPEIHEYHVYAVFQNSYICIGMFDTYREKTEFINKIANLMNAVETEINSSLFETNKNLI